MQKAKTIIKSIAAIIGTRVFNPLRHLRYRFTFYLRWTLPPKLAKLRSFILEVLISPAIIGFILLVLSILAITLGHIRQRGSFDVGLLLDEMWANVGAELASIAITVLIIDRIYRIQSERKEKALRESELRTQQQLYEYRLYRAATQAEKQVLLYEMCVRNLLEGINLAQLDLSGIALGRLPAGSSIDPFYPLPRHEEPKTISMRGANLSGCLLNETDFSHIDLRGAGFVRTQMNNTVFNNTDLRGAVFTFATLENVKMRGANIEGVLFYRSHISGLDLTDAKINGVDFDRNFPSDVTLPDGRKLEYWSDFTDYEIKVMTHGSIPEKRPEILG